MNFQRALDNLSGDWTTIQQALNINVANYSALSLSIDVMVIQHNLEAGGFVAPAFEWPVVVQVNYLDVTNTAQIWRFGWFLDPPGDSINGPVNDPGQGLIPFYNDLLVNPNVWVANTFNMFNQLPQAKTITNIRVGSSGWNFVGNVDNVSLQGTLIPEPSTLMLFGTAILGLIGYCWLRRKQAA
ncbi:PEP-CTERM sorting domain-containing protein [Candidatus Poribacteria bacterium]|nr:PEP-CTERM sorting domain-containing protein [Candidatus Poribacteria bacterium]